MVGFITTACSLNARGKGFNCRWVNLENIFNFICILEVFHANETGEKYFKSIYFNSFSKFIGNLWIYRKKYPAYFASLRTCLLFNFFSQKFILSFFFFFSYWELNPGLHTCRVSILSLSSIPGQQFILLRLGIFFSIYNSRVILLIASLLCKDLHMPFMVACHSWGSYASTIAEFLVDVFTTLLKYTELMAFIKDVGQTVKCVSALGTLTACITFQSLMPGKLEISILLPAPFIFIYITFISQFS